MGRITTMVNRQRQLRVPLSTQNSANIWVQHFVVQYRASPKLEEVAARYCGSSKSSLDHLDVIQKCGLTRLGTATTPAAAKEVTD